MERQSYINALKRAFLVLEKQQQDPQVAQYLLLEMLGWNQSRFQLHQDELMPLAQQKKFAQAIQLAVLAYPPQYILERAWFYGRQFYVNPAVLIPRQDSETMIAQILATKTQNLHLLELGTGSGALALTLALEGKWQTVTATDISPAALKVAQINQEYYQVPLKLLTGDLFAPVTQEQFDVIVFNPPYIAKEETKYMDTSVLQYEPKQALFAPQKGLAFYQRFFAEVANYLSPKGSAYLEFGFQQQAEISTIFQEQLPDWQIDFFRDLAQQPRFLRLRRKEVN
ncbi:peptide chain release factor N(5)-glutamine methyltransferase [Lactobacillus sp. DCY120]|uniref:peptide chain release factor N(5)-glutamine methyltransferase n=1 Tax=Bombilactobacillus apium TaxID=2675299 RepID=A0A850QV33_9LACO|nr:peptide chain release factor N(5)-glutamine methyltransferase [Bombilactobacillus apium]NVY95634.1 peptide chain release factor N(5)-glutamine methyltransferase [Bombilactobacillus apium]